MSMKEKKNKVQTNQHQRKTTRRDLRQQLIIEDHTAGPLPHPDLLKQYGEINPDFPNIIVGMARDQQAHDFAIDNKQTDAQIKQVSAGQRLAFLTILLYSSFLFFCLYTGQYLSAAIVGAVGGALVGIARYFAAIKSKDSDDIDQLPKG